MFFTLKKIIPDGNSDLQEGIKNTRNRKYMGKHETVFCLTLKNTYDNMYKAVTITLNHGAYKTCGYNICTCILCTYI